MPLELLLTLVVGGIAAVVLLVHLVGWSKPLTLSAKSAREEFVWDNPGAVIRDVVLSEDGRSALVELEDGGTGFVEVLGDGTLTRRLARETVVRVDRAGARLNIVLSDFTDPRLTITFSNEEKARKWAARLAGDNGSDSG